MSTLSPPAHALLDCAALARELRVSRTAAETIMRHVPAVRVDGLRKVYARWGDVDAYLRKCTQASTTRAA